MGEDVEGATGTSHQPSSPATVLWKQGPQMGEKTENGMVSAQEAMWTGGGRGK